jgi:hypothetical protein
MATRMIVTSQPDVACDVCGRRLLRGEQPDVFLAGGRRRMVCELCAPRASAEGWLREAEQSRTLSLSPARPREGRNPLARWRRPRRLSSESAPEPVEASATPAEDELDDELHEVVDGGPGEPVAGTVPVFAGAVVEPVAGAEAEIVEMAESDEVKPVAAAEAEIVEMAESDQVKPAEEGSWRDAWMFVGE